jgi:YidC/Oxa1 family membrane protein insertase
MNMDRKAFASIALCLGFYLTYTTYLNSKYPHLQNPASATKQQATASSPEATAGSSETSTASSATGTAAQENSSANLASPSDTNAPLQNITTAPLSQIGSENLQIDTDVTSLRFDNATSGLSKVELKSYTKSIGSEALNLAEPMVMLQPGLLDEVILPNQYAASREGRSFTFTRKTSAWEITHVYSIPETGYSIDVTTKWTNLTNATLPLTGVLNFTDSPRAPEIKGSWIPGAPSERPQLVVGFEKEHKRHDAENFCEDKETSTLISEAGVDLAIIGFDRHYFTSSLLLTHEKLGYDIQKKSMNNSAHCSYTFRVAKSFGDVGPGTTKSLSSKLWFGPKDTKITDTYSPDLRKMFDYGFFGILTDPLLKGIELFYRLLGNWGLAIIFMTFLLKMLFYPLTKKAAIAMNAQKKWQPEMTRLREKFKDDPKKQQQELMAFMAQHKINPIKGCLPILPQIPVFFAFYTALSNSIQLRQAPFMGWISDLTHNDPYYIFPVLWGISMVIQQRLTPTAGLDKTQERVMMLMPIMFTAMMLTLPAGMLLYMLTNTVVTIAQQAYLNRRLENA